MHKHIQKKKKQNFKYTINFDKQFRYSEIILDSFPKKERQRAEKSID